MPSYLAFLDHKHKIYPPYIRHNYHHHIDLNILCNLPEDLHQQRTLPENTLFDPLSQT